MRGTLAAVWFCALAVVSAADGAGRIAVTAGARSIQPGELVVLTITTPETASDVQVRAFNRDIPAYRVDGLTWRALVGIDLAVSAGAYTSSIEARSGPRTIRGAYTLEVRPRRFPVRTLTVDPVFVDPPLEVGDRIAHEAALLQQLLNQSSPERLWSGPFVPPVPGVNASRFGARSVFNGKARSPHSGADFVSPIGTPIASPNAGRVVLARNLYFTGNTVVIDHGLGLLSLLAHLSAFGIREGDMVAAGQPLGEVGDTGRVTGPHLHWAARLGGARIDPQAILAVLDRELPRH